MDVFLHSFYARFQGVLYLGLRKAQDCVALLSKKSSYANITRGNVRQSVPVITVHKDTKLWLDKNVGTAIQLLVSPKLDAEHPKSRLQCCLCRAATRSFVYLTVKRHCQTLFIGPPPAKATVDGAGGNSQRLNARLILPLHDPQTAAIETQNPTAVAVRRGDRQGPLITPPSITPRDERLSANACNAHPVRYVLRFLPEREIVRVVSTVYGLFGWCGPAHIARLVIAVFVRISIKAMCWCWTFSHVSKKRLKGAPLRTYRDTGPSVLRVIWGIRVVASLVHLLPVFVFRRARTAVGPNQETRQTPTVPPLPIPESRTITGRNLPAVTQAPSLLGSSVALASRCYLKNEKFPEAVARLYDWSGWQVRDLLKATNFSARLSQWFTPLVEPFCILPQTETAQCR